MPRKLRMILSLEGNMRESAKRLKPFINIPVGEFIKDEMEYRGWNQEDLANIIGTTPKTVNQIINGKQGITVPTAIKFGTIFGQSTEYWLNLCNRYGEVGTSQ